MGIASLVLGIVSLVCIIGVAGLYPGIIGAVVGIVGIILGVMGKSNPDRSGIATAGLVCSIIGTVLNLIFTIACWGCAACAIGSGLYY